MKKNVTLKQIAKELEVSVSTVSKALRDNDEISLETRQKIQAFAKLYNYSPNSIALSLRNRKTKTLGVIVPEIVHHFFTKVIQGIEKIANKRGYNVIIALSNESFDKEVLNMQTLVNGNIDGFIISISKETMKLQDFHHLNETIHQGVPIVMFDRAVDGVLCDKVIVDDEEGARKATQQLIDSGCKKIALITTEEYVSVGVLRTNGYKTALKNSGEDVDESLIIVINEQIYSENTTEIISKKLKEVLELHPDTDGILGVNEFYAVAAANYFKKLGRKIPEEISIIAFSDGVLPRYSYPTLTAVSQHGEKLGKHATNLLIDKLENITPEENYKTIIVETDLVQRDSTRKLKLI